MAWAQRAGKSWQARWKGPEGSKPAFPSKSGFSTKRKALDYAEDQEALVRAGEWIDPRKGKITWDEWWIEWVGSIDVEPATLEGYEDLWRIHIQPRWGETSIGKTKLKDANTWIKALREGKVETGPAESRRQRPYAPRTVNGVRKLMSLMLSDAAEADMLGRNVLAVRGSRSRGRRVDQIQTTVKPKLGATPEQVLAAAVNMHQVVGPGSDAGIGAFLRVLTGGWAGIRPGEQAALSRPNCAGLALSVPRLVVHEEDGNLQDLSRAGLKLKAPKSGVGRTTIVPPGLAALLIAWLEHLDGDIVFPSQDGTWWRRRRWDYRWTQASNGGLLELRGPARHAPAGLYFLERATPGLEFKGLRRFYNTCLTDIDVPEVGRKRQLGHKMDDDLQEAYSLVSAIVEQRLLAGMERLWIEAFSGYAGIAALEIISKFSLKCAQEIKEALPPGEGRRAILTGQ
jgi:hypothetical protein